MAVTLWLPLVCSGPFQPPLAVQDVALVEDHVKITGCPTKALPAPGESVTVGGVVGGWGEGEEGELLPPQPTTTRHAHAMVATPLMD